MMPRRKRHRHSDTRAEILWLMVRDGPTCYLCGGGPSPGDPFESEHVVPLSCGGSDDLANKRLAHGSCNRWKGRG